MEVCIGYITYDPVKAVGFIIKQKTGFICNGIKCEDIKGDEGGFRLATLPLPVIQV